MQAPFLAPEPPLYNIFVHYQLFISHFRLPPPTLTAAKTPPIAFRLQQGFYYCRHSFISIYMLRASVAGHAMHE